MDILDIDEIEDDFGIFEEKIQDDVTNILKQWKIGNNKKDAVFDSRTFTRPKGSIIRNSIDGSQFKNPQTQENQNGMSLKIGGLVSNVQKNFLNDISPPNSICSSINFENETMSNSLITSADFSNISFFKTSLMDSNIDFAFKNNLKQYNNIENECRFKYEKNIPNDVFNSEITMKSSVSKDNQPKDNSEKNDLENFNLLTDSTKENSPNCPEIDNNGSSFQYNTQIMSNTFKKRNSTIIYDNSLNNLKTKELDEKSIDINKTFLRKSKIEPRFNKTFDIDLNIPVNIPDKPNHNPNETHTVKSEEIKEVFNDTDINLTGQNNLSQKNAEETFSTSTPLKSLEIDANCNTDFSPITPFNKYNNFKKQKNEEELSSNENMFDTPIELKRDGLSLARKSNIHKTMPDSFEHDELDVDNLSDLSDKIDNVREDAMKKSLETIKKRYSHKFDKTTTVPEKSIQKISNPFPENGRLLSRRSRLNDNLIINQNIKNDPEDKRSLNIESQSKLENSLRDLKLNKSENLNKEVVYNDERPELNQIIEKDNTDEKDVDFKKKNESKRSRNDDRFKTIKINKVLTEQCKGEILDINDTIYTSSTAFDRIDKNAKISHFENEPLKFESKINSKIKEQQGMINEKVIPGTLKNLKYERMSKIENLGKAISASNLESATKIESNSNFKFAVPAPVKQIKSPMGTKAKSFHNLASNNFGFGLRKASLQAAPKLQENNFSLAAPNTIVKSNITKTNDTNSKSAPTLRPTNIQKRSGLLRPSSGYFSRGVSSEMNTLQATFIKDNEKSVKVDSNCSNFLNSNSDTINKDEISLTTVTKPSKILKPTESKLPTNIKRSGLPRPSLHYRK